MTLRARIALAMAILAGITAIVVGATTYVSTDQRVRGEVDSYLDTYVHRYQDIDGRQAAVTCGQAGNRRGGNTPFGPATPGAPDEGVEGVVFQCVGTSGQVVTTIGTSTLPVSARDADIAAVGAGTQTRTVEANGKVWRVATVGISGGGAVQIARDYGETHRVLSALRLRLLGIVIAASAIAALIGWLIARRSTAPLAHLTDAAETVAVTGRLDVEVPPAGRDETGRLARAFATMLAALGRSREQQQQLVQDAGHELRTPLTSLRTNIETLQRYSNLSEETRRMILDDLQAETRELGALVDELVQLATDTWDDEAETSVDVDAITAAIIDRARRRSGREITLDAQPWSIEGRPRLLERAIGNLVDNATKFSDAPSPIEVVVRPGVVIVRDHGPGISAIDQPHLFDRFYRADTARSKPGSGLGLAIVEQIVTAHGGTITAANHPGGGAVFTISMPVTD